MADAVELAAHTGLPVETVLRVLQRQPTNEAARRAVADAVAALGLPEYPRPDDHVEVLPEAEAAPAVSGAPVDGQALAIELRDLFAELVERLERERRERVEDLELTTELIAETWRNVDRRLARLEKVVARLGRQDVVQLSSGNGAEIRRLEDVWRPESR